MGPKSIRSKVMLKITILVLFGGKWKPGLPDLMVLVICHFPIYHHSIPCYQKHGSRHQNHVPKSIRSEVMLKITILVLFWGKMDTRVARSDGSGYLTLSNMSPFNSLLPKTWI